MENIDRTQFGSTFRRKLIYVFRINDEAHKGYLKIGDATLESNKPNDQLPSNCHDLNYAARKRIDSYTSTAGISYDLLYTELAIYKDKETKKLKAFRDYKVHSVLTRSGIKRKLFDTNKKQNEWFKLDLETAKKAIECVKNNKTALDENQITNDNNPIVFRPEQQEAIEKTVKRFKTHEKMLWNAKMRFGKTLSALQVVKDMKFEKTIIITHRPVVDMGWFEDFGKIFYDSPEYQYGSKNNGHTFKDLLKNKNKFVYFASMQDLRGAEKVGGNFDKNNEIYKTDWDFVIVDEAHEGTQTELGQAVLDAIIKPGNDYKTYQLQLSGTPFNLLTNFESDDIFTWDYIMEQEAKQNWSLYHDGDSNPYDELPRMNIFTYHLEKQFKFLDLDDKAFNFREFFRTWTGDIKKDGKQIPSGANKGDFVHESDIKNFLKLICKKDDKTNYPFSTDEYRNYFRHSLWMVPGVKEAAALSKLLQADDSPFLGFKVVNVAGDGDEEEARDEALKKVRKAITNNPEETYTITLSCGKLTTGVSVPEWTAVLMLAGSYSTKASQYLQTIFRVQTPANINGSIKEDAYVFDFAPDRTLKMVAEAVQLSSTSKGGSDDSKQLAAFLNYCPVISIEGSDMVEYSVNHLLQELKKAYVERVIRNGFDDTKIYNDELLKLDDIQLQEFEKLKKIIGQSKQTKSSGEIDINNQGFTEEEWETIQAAKKKPKRELTPEELEALKELKKKKENAKTAMSILRGISIRMPLLVYGMDKDINIDITVDNFADDNLIDDQSWAEFMPEGVTKQIFKEFSKYYDKDVFVAASRRIRAISKTADELEPTERVQKIADLFSTFKNPDKETVLTPWNVVNLHMSETIGGYDFFTEEHLPISRIDEPRFVENKLTTSEIINNDAQILEINSKTGLYPLYITYSLYRKQLDQIEDNNQTFETKLKLWDKIVEDNVFVVCKTSMAKSITRRTLVGYRNKKVNTHAFDDLIMQFKEKPDKFVQKITKESFWGKGTGNMKFNAVVGNPPYQGTNHSQIYPYFYLASKELGDNVSLIFPIGWQEPKNGNNLSKLNNEETKTDKQIVFIDNRQNVFPGISGAEWTNIILWRKGYDNGLNGEQKILTNGEDPEVRKLIWNTEEIVKPSEITKLSEIVITSEEFESIETITSSRKPFGIATNVFKDRLLSFTNEKQQNDDYVLYGASNVIKYVPNNVQLPKAHTSLRKYKVFVPYAWGNMSEENGLGGAYSDIIVASPRDICTETYLVSGEFNSKDKAKKHAKYLMTKFARALLYVNKYSQHSTTAWGAIPVQDYSEDWWDGRINEIDDKLFEKYNVPENIRKFVLKNIQTKTEDDIVNF